MKVGAATLTGSTEVAAHSQGDLPAVSTAPGAAGIPSQPPCNPLGHPLLSDWGALLRSEPFPLPKNGEGQVHGGDLMPPSMARGPLHCTHDPHSHAALGEGKAQKRNSCWAVARAGQTPSPQQCKDGILISV